MSDSIEKRKKQVQRFLKIAQILKIKSRKKKHYQTKYNEKYKLKQIVKKIRKKERKIKNAEKKIRRDAI